MYLLFPRAKLLLELQRPRACACACVPVWLSLCLCPCACTDRVSEAPPDAHEVEGVQLPKCSSMSEMMTAVCDKTAAEIAKKVEEMKTNKENPECADDGVAFSPPPPPPLPKNTTFFVTVTVTLPYTKAEFDQAKQDKYTAAMAATAGTIAANVVIESITEKHRRAGAVDVKTKVASPRHVPVVSHAGIHHNDQQIPLCGGVIVQL